MSVRVAVAPSVEPLERAVLEAGGELVEPEHADAIVWSDPRHPDELRALLDRSPARWIQLPFAGIERFVAAGAIVPDRTWTCAKEIYGTACAEQALGSILLAARRLHEHARGRSWWRGSPDAHRRVAGSTAVIVGTGGIGRELARMLGPLDVEVLGVNRTGRAVQGFIQTWPSAALKDVAPHADWLVVAAAATQETFRIVDGGVLASMRSSGWVINVARGSLVDTDALVDALRRDVIGGAALDVTDPEPLPEDHPLWSMPNALITSHTANTWTMAMPDLVALVRRNVEHFARAEPLEGLVDPALGY